ncbi:MAG: hypothetical protein E6Q97_15890 [Desulfurellales bacterium]|nr:MAG: hypothetical protein E6Q97_15890 [Desulfurellales bacterium]
MTTYQQRKRAILRAAIIALAMFAFFGWLLYRSVHAESCIGSVGPDDQPVVECRVLWLPVVSR